MFSPAILVGGLLFSGIGFVAFCYGKKMGRMWPMLLGVALMVYPYFVPNAWLLYVLGSIITAALYITRDRDS